MPVSIELLDDYHKNTAFTIIAGKNILLKFVPNTQPRAKFRDVINIPDLPKSAEMVFIKAIVKSSQDLKNTLGNYIKEWTVSPTNTASLKTHREKVAEISQEIIKDEIAIGISICKPHYLSFCSKCNAYVGEVDNLTTSCPKCGQMLDASGKMVVSYLDGIENAYLGGGFWFEDYIARVLTADGWKVWTHGSVMGTSGIMHPIDFLALKDSKVLVGECKTGSVDTRDISHFLVQKLDIPSHFGLFLSFLTCSSKSTASFFNVSTSLLLDDVGNKGDVEILTKINAHIAKFNQ